jgi:hypothetical protein
MHRAKLIASLVVCPSLLLCGSHPASAQCTLPYQLTNGQTADATQVMANFNALVTCLGNAAPGGATNSLQYKSGTGTLGGVGPLTNGQLVIGSTGAAPQAQTLTAGSGILITNAPGGITIAASGAAAGAGLYRQIMSTTPTSGNTGLSNWLNQGSAVVSDSSVGLSISAPSSGSSSNLAGRFMPAPSPPYTIKTLIAATRNSNNSSSVGVGWYDGSNKLHLIIYLTNGSSAPILQVQRYNSPTSWNGNDFQSEANSFAQPIWLQVGDDGTNVSFSFSQDGANYVQVFSVAKSSGFLGASGYTNVIFAVNPQGGQTIGTLMSWAQN